MKRVALVALFAFVIAGFICAQNIDQLSNKPFMEKKATVTADGTIIPDQQRFGTTVLKSSKPHLTPWWSASNDWSSTAVVDWGFIWAVDTNNLPDEAIDGFQFQYVTNAIDTDGMTWGLFFWDQATGWNDALKVQEWGVIFSGFPNHALSPPTWFATGWTFTFDLAIGDFSGMFLMDKGDENTKINDGVEFGFWNFETAPGSPNPPVVPYWGFQLAKPDGAASDGNFAQSDDVYDRYDSTFTYLGSFWFGGYTVGGTPAANATWELYAGGPANNTKYGGIGQLTGNDASLYTAGNFAVGGNAHFIMRMNGMTQEASLCACLNTNQAKYYAGLDFFKIFPVPIPWRQVMDNQQVNPTTFDYATYDFTNMGAKIATKSIFFQGIITDKFNGNVLTPIDGTLNYVRTN
jgi:hypothetical protein